MAVFLVTGGAGFIGSHLTDHLLSLGHQVRALDSLASGKVANLAPGAEFIEASILDTDRIEVAFRGISGCFHLAAVASVQRSVEAPFETSRVNTLGTIGVFELAARTDIPVVYASSAAIYGPNMDLPLRKSARPQPLSPYAADKLSNELFAQALGGTRSLRSFGLRLFNVYGPRQDPNSPYSGVVSIFLQRAKDSQDLVIFGDGTQSRDFIHVSDVVRFFDAAMARTRTSAPVANVCTGTAISISRLAELAASGRGRIVYEDARPGDILRSLGSPELAAQTLGVSAQVSFEQGIATFS